MLISKKATIKWNAKTKNHYVTAGYKFTCMGDSLQVNVKDLTKGSYAEIILKCDYCHQLYTSKWYTYFNLKKELLKTDCCGNHSCMTTKAKEVFIAKYGVDKIAHIPDVAEKRKSTNLEKYGCENVFSNLNIKKKIVATNRIKYGVDYSQQNEEVRKKTIATCKERYGVENYIELLAGKYIGKNSPRWKGGVKYHRIQRSTREYIQWRNSVFSRDHYLCRKCHTKGSTGEINAHHISNWKDFQELRYDVNNGITLCTDCHIRFHSTYGKRFTNKIQLNEFLNLDKKIC